ncbi:MAG: pyridoxamine 5'-phosphate oxidase family protein [Deltaproteobacteria bacterium]|uniref:Pyridoxamine 5'-phosphate oxidase family protein n=1 Tax=Candidatus Zymogenus saltonus TaxID=2844893 RepID=A0A9D8PMB1_9DELT|nr:pyridoxamine 5'-phosphate oxidase family protein [Candidatus Zymogenus saltonus]
MRKREKLVSDVGEIERILTGAKVLRVAFSKDDRPYIVPVNFGYESGRLFFHTGYRGKKMEFLMANPEVCFEVDSKVEVVPSDEACGFSCRYMSIVGYGTARLVEDVEEKIRSLDIIMAHYSDKKFEYKPEVLKITAVVEITISYMTGRRSGY